MAINIFVILRILIGSLLIVSGFEKLINPYQNFLYIVQSYEFLSVPLEELVARVLPWVELFLGVFLVLGFWLKSGLRCAVVLIIMFLGVVAQALLRKLPIDECGCFGSLVSLPLYGVFIFDSILLILTGLMIKHRERTSVLSLDQYFKK